MRRNGLMVLAAVCLLAGAAVGAEVATTGPGGKPAGKVTLEAAVKGRSAAILDDLQKSGDSEHAADRAAALFDQVIATGSEKNLEAFREADYTWRLTSQLAATPA